MDYSRDDFGFDLPEELIAQTPARPRDHARLLIYNRKTRTLVDDFFYNLNDHLPLESTLVLNNSKVEKCRLQIDDHEIFVLETINPTTVRALVRPGKRFKLHDSVKLRDLVFTVTDIDDSGIRTLSLSKPIDSSVYDPYRLTPLPPYIAQDESLAEEYQTVYANPLGSKAAPTAGLHFTSELLTKIRKTHSLAEVTLHVGLGTFAPVKVTNLRDHVMHEEIFEITKIAADVLSTASHRTAVGTTSVRTLESADHPFRAQTGATSIFITPGYEFTATDALITNFHLPHSTLLMLVAAFMGSVEELHRVYKHAIQGEYRFYSFGDAMLIL